MIHEYMVCLNCVMVVSVGMKELKSKLLALIDLIVRWMKKSRIFDAKSGGFEFKDLWVFSIKNVEIWIILLEWVLIIHVNINRLSAE